MKNISKKEPTQKQIKELKDKIDTMNEKENEYMYMLIVSYQSEVDCKPPSLTLPYNGKFIGDSSVFDLSEMPSSLKQLLIKFASLQTE